MALKIEQFVRKPFVVDAVKVNPENLEDVANWCQGEVRVSEEQGTQEKYVKVRVHRPMTERQTMAFPGDLVLYAGTGFKVYTPKAFEKSFEPATENQKVARAEADEQPTLFQAPKAASN